MVGIVTGQGMGLERSSASVLGSRGQVGSASEGRDGGGVFVNAATGNLIVSRQDEILLGLGPDMAISRTYNSQGTVWDGDNDDNWRISAARRIVGANGAATVTRIEWDGSETVYTRSGSTYVGRDGQGAYDTLAWDGTQWLWTDGGGHSTEAYDSTGRLLASRDSDGNALTYTYVGALLSRITNQNGEYTAFVYGGAGGNQLQHIATQAAAGSVRVRYGYDASNRLSSATVDLSPADGSVADGRSYTTTYAYDGASKRIASITQTDGSRLDIAYTQSGSDYRVTRLTQTVAGRVTRVTGLYYDLASRATTITNPLGGATIMRYDASGNLTQITHPQPAPGIAAPTTSFAYNANGDVASVTEGGRTTTYEYDGNGNLKLSRDASGSTATRTYGSRNELLTSTEFLVADPDGAGAAAAATPVTTRYAYDAENHLRFKVTADGRVTEYRYNAIGTLASTLYYAGAFYSTAGLGAAISISESALAAWAAGIADKTTIQRSDTTYDFRGNLSTVTSYSRTLSDGSGDLASTYTRTIYVYDSAGNLLNRQVSGLSGSESFVYDGLNRIVSSTDAAGAVTSIAFNDAATTTTVTLSGGLTRVSVYNKAGERVSYTESGGDIPTAVATEAYDALGRLRMQTDSTGRSTYFLYDAVGRKAADISADGAVTEYGYDSGNRLVKTVAYMNKLSTSQIALLAGFSAGGAGGATAGGVSGIVSSNLMSNGGFEQSGSYTATATGRSNTTMPGWTKANSETFEQVVSGQMGVTASEGSFWLDLESVASTGIVPTGSNLLVNGSFGQSGSYVQTATGRSNTTLPGWAKNNAETFEQVASGQLGVSTFDGGFWLDLESIPTTGPAPVGPNLLVNGGFETSGNYIVNATGRANSNLPGWSKTNPEAFEQVETDATDINGPIEGNWVLDLDSVLPPGLAVGGPNLIVNGSFEQSAASYTVTATGRYNDPALDIPGWTRLNAQGFEQVNSGVDGVAATDGSFYLDMEANGDAESRMDISQTISGLAEGQQLTLRFDYANTAGLVFDVETFENSGALEVYWNGALIGRVSSHDSTMVTKGFNVTSVEGDNVLRFREIGVTDGKGVYLDNVRLQAAAPPASGGNMDIYQMVSNLTAGQVLQLQFDYARLTQVNSSTFEVWWNDTLVATVTNGKNFMQTASYFVTAINGDNKLRFKGTGTVDGAGAALDNVRLFATQSPPNGGNMDIYQTVGGLAAGQVVQLQFDHANRTTAASGSFEVWWNNTLVATIAETGTAMQTKTYQLAAIAGNNTLRFKGLGTVDAAGASIDNVRLFATQAITGGGNMDISQTVGGLAAGQVMQLEFDHANRTTSASGGFEVYWNGALVATIAESGTAMQTKTYFVNAIAGSNTLRFRSLGTVDGEGASLDNVRLFATQSGGPAAPTPTDPLAGLRPVASSLDFWMWSIYDPADRLIETIDGAGRATLYSYDAASRLVSSTSYATPFDAGYISFFKSMTPVMPYLPATNSATDRTTRNFYDNDGRIVGTLDGAGGLNQIFHDAAGQKIREIAYANPAAASLRATGTFAQLLASVGTSESDRRVDYVYDQRGLLRFTIDATGHPTEAIYDSVGQLIRAVDYAGTIPASASYSLAYVQGQISATGLTSNAANRTTRSVYDGAGRLAFTIDAEGGVIALTHDLRGNLIRETRYAAVFTASGDQNLAAMQGWAASHAGDSGNRVQRHVFDAAGQLAYSVDPEGFVIEHRYDTGGRIVQTIRYPSAYVVPDWATKSSLAAQIGALPAGAVVTSNAYDSAGRLTDVTDGEGVVIHYVYDGLSQVTEETFAHGTADSATLRRTYDAGGRTISQTLGHGTAEAASTTYGYDALGNLLTVTDPRGFTSSRGYDALGRVVSMTSPIDASTSATVSNAYNSFGDVVRSTDALGHSSYNYYDKLGRLVAARDAENYVTETAHNAFNEVTSVTRRHNRATNAASAAVLPAFAAHANDSVTRFEHDRRGLLVKTIDAEGHYEQYTLDAFGQHIAVRNKLGGVTTNAFDRRGLLVAETLPLASIRSDGSQQAASVTNRFEYDGRGNRTRTIEAYGLSEQRSTTYVYDRTDRLIETRGDVVAVLSQSDHNSLGNVTPTERYQYDRRGNLIEMVDALGARTLFYHDRLNRRIATLNAAGTLMTYAHDANGNLTSTRIYATAVAVPGSAGGSQPAAPGGEYRETSHTYDRLNRLLTTSMTGIRTGAWNGASYVTSVGTVSTAFQYDANGNVTKTTDPSGGVTWSYYDRLGRVVTTVDAENFLTGWTYDAEGNVLTERRAAQQATGVGTSTPLASPHPDDRVTHFTYDRNGRRLTEQRTGVTAYTLSATGGLVPASTASTIAYAYNGLGQVTRKTEASGDFVDYVHDSFGRLLTETRAPYSDQAGASVRPTVRYFYDGLDNLTLTRQGDETVSTADRFTRYDYGAGGRLAVLTDAAGATRHYAYDAAGNLLRESYDRQRADGTASHEAVLYGRDQLGRIVSQGLAAWNGSAWVRGDTQNTAYNAFGDVSQRGLNGLWQEQFAYDNRGLLWRSNSGDGVWRYFISDANGRKTLTIESEGSDLAGQSIEQVLAIATQNGAHAVGGAYVDGINAAIEVLDKRGLAVARRLPKRQLSEAGAAEDLSVSRGYNAFGEVAWEKDARNNQTNYVYNTMGRNVSIQRPTVSITLENGTTQSATPTDHFFYDSSGRLIGMQDANGNRTTRSLLAGSGYGGSDALVTAEYHADGGVFRTFYDAYGDARILRNELGQDETRTYDAMGRLLSQTHRGGLTDHYVYDLLGQRIQHWNNVLQNPIYGPPEQVWVEDPPYWEPYYGWVYPGGHWETHTPIIGYAPDKELTDYDLQGRVTSHRAFGGDVTTTSYSWSGALATGGMGTFGGWTQTTTYANGRSSTEQSDIFGRDVYKSDLGGHVFTFGYDLAGRMIQRGGAETFNFHYLNTGLLASMSTGWGTPGWGNEYDLTKTVYGYDAAGNKTSEAYTKEGGYWEIHYDPYYGYETGRDYRTYFHSYQNATAAYDGLGRMTSWSEAGNATTPAASIQYEYDAAGNVRRTYASYRPLDANGTAAASPTVSDQWYRYDSMNRVVTAKGVLSGGQIARSTTGTDYTYDVAGQRMSATRTTWETAWIHDPWSWDPYYGHTQMPVAYEHDRREDFSYDGAGNLDIVRIAESSYWDNGDGTLTVTPPPATGAVKADYTFDLMARMTRQVDYTWGTTVGYQRDITYNAKNQVASEVTISRQGADTITTSSFHDYGFGANYALGAIVGTSASISKNNVYQNGTSTTTNYHWWDGAVQASIVHQPNTSSSTTFTTSYNYSASGVVNSVYVGDGRPRSITFVNDMNGQAIRRDESDNNWNQGDPHEVWYRFNGKQLGYTGNNGTLDTDYQTSIDNRTRPPATGAFRFGSTFASPHADFDLSVDSINSYNQGAAGGSYTVRAGDTLASIAAQIWGDSSLWYKLAEANGMSAANGLTEGQRLTLPAGVMKSHHNASTFRPYDPSETVGDVSPTTPQPQKATARKSNKCGVFGAILLVIIAVAVTVITAGAAVAALSPTISGLGAGISAVAAGTTGLSAGALIGIGAASSALGSIASQGFGVATGIQEKFDWKGVAMAGIGGGVGAGFAALGTFSGIGNAVVRGVVSGAVTSAVTQGIGVVTGLQHKFDWAGVAAAGVGGGVAVAVGSRLGSLNQHAAEFISSGAAAIAGAAARSLIDGSSFGDNLLAALPDVIGGTLGNLIAEGLFPEEETATPADAAPGGMAVPESGDGEVQFLNAAYQDGDGGSSLITCLKTNGTTCLPFEDFKKAPDGSFFKEKYHQAIADLKALGIDEPTDKQIVDELRARAAENTRLQDMKDALKAHLKISPDMVTPIAGDILGNQARVEKGLKSAKDFSREAWQLLEDNAPTVADFLHGLIGGEYSERESAAAELGKIVSGLTPPGDLRDTIAAMMNLKNDRSPAAVTLALLSVAGWIPGPGDAIKAVGKKLLRWTGRHFPEITRSFDDVIDRVRGIHHIRNLPIDAAVDGFRKADLADKVHYARRIAELSTVTYRKGDRVVLGPGDEYIKHADRHGGIVLDTGVDVYEKIIAGLSKQQAKAEFWLINQAFLDQRLAKGKPIEFVGNWRSRIATKRGSFTEMEYNYLKANAPKYGYRWSGSSWIK